MIHCIWNSEQKWNSGRLANAYYKVSNTSDSYKNPLKISLFAFAKSFYAQIQINLKYLGISYTENIKFYPKNFFQ